MAQVKKAQVKKAQVKKAQSKKAHGEDDTSTDLAQVTDGTSTIS
jgi:hypothetical protein